MRREDMGRRTTVRFARAIIFASIFPFVLGLVSPGTSWGDVAVTPTHRVDSAPLIALLEYTVWAQDPEPVSRQDTGDGGAPGNSDAFHPTNLIVERASVTARDVLPGLSVQPGRQRFEDEREWVYDENLDAARVFYRAGRFGLELSASREELNYLNGEDTSPGHGLDVVVGYRDEKDFDLELVLGAFVPGTAFWPDADTAYFAGFEFQFEF